jgi:hypothetical protein
MKRKLNEPGYIAAGHVGNGIARIKASYHNKENCVPAQPSVKDAIAEYLEKVVGLASYEFNMGFHFDNDHSGPVIDWLYVLWGNGHISRSYAKESRYWLLCDPAGEPVVIEFELSGILAWVKISGPDEVFVSEYLPLPDQPNPHRESQWLAPPAVEEKRLYAEKLVKEGDKPGAKIAFSELAKLINENI